MVGAGIGHTAAAAAALWLRINSLNKASAVLHHCHHLRRQPWITVHACLCSVSHCGFSMRPAHCDCSQMAQQQRLPYHPPSWLLALPKLCRSPHKQLPAQQQLGFRCLCSNLLLSQCVWRQHVSRLFKTCRVKTLQTQRQQQQHHRAPAAAVPIIAAGSARAGLRMKWVKTQHAHTAAALEVAACHSSISHSSNSMQAAHSAFQTAHSPPHWHLRQQKAATAQCALLQVPSHSQLALATDVKATSAATALITPAPQDHSSSSRRKPHLHICSRRITQARCLSSCST